MFPGSYFTCYYFACTYFPGSTVGIVTLHFADFITVDADSDGSVFGIDPTKTIGVN